MNVIESEGQQAVDPRRYARFTRRLQGIAIDFILFLVALIGALQIAVLLNNDSLARVVGVTFVAGFLLYEPLSVSLVGGTIGHYLSNLRVVDDRSHGNVSLAKAVARVVIKAALGWYSFISMAAARRHQAMHDLLTRSTVQIRDPTKARPSDYSRERVELSRPGMPSRVRRLVVIAGYLLAAFVILAFVLHVLVLAGVYSRDCIRYNLCTGGDRLADIAAGIAVLVLSALCIGLGWRGRLGGARQRV